MIDSIEGLAYRKVSDYVLVRAIGRGTHYTLYQAVDPRLGQMVVIKILHVTMGKSMPEAEQELASVLETRLQREASALSILSHPNIPGIYEIGEQDGHPFLVMEYLYGHPLRQHLDLRSLSMEGALQILEQVASAVDAVHEHGILHRDIRASNVMLLHDGRVKLVEFGLARQPGDTTVTLMGALVGEPAYMAPEQLRNQPASPQSDIWAVGVLLYEMLAGAAPFQGANFQMVAHQVIMGQPAPVPGMSEAVQLVLTRALEKDPEKRYSTAHEMVQALRKATGVSAAHEAARREFSTKKAAPKFAAAWAGAIAVALAASVLLGLSLGHHSPALTPTVSAATLPPSPAPLKPTTLYHDLPPAVPPAAAPNKTPFGPSSR
ncbi:MAG: serine/threonine-protein kinase [Janthinobacterium lividum]